MKYLSPLLIILQTFILVTSLFAQSSGTTAASCGDTGIPVSGPGTLHPESDRAATITPVSEHKSANSGGVTPEPPSGSSSKSPISLSGDGTANHKEGGVTYRYGGSGPATASGNPTSPETVTVTPGSNGGDPTFERSGPYGPRTPQPGTRVGPPPSWPTTGPKKCGDDPTDNCGFPGASCGGNQQCVACKCQNCPPTAACGPTKACPGGMPCNHCVCMNCPPAAQCRPAGSPGGEKKCPDNKKCELCQCVDCKAPDQCGFSGAPGCAANETCKNCKCEASIRTGDPEPTATLKPNGQPVEGLEADDAMTLSQLIDETNQIEARFQLDPDFSVAGSSSGGVNQISGLSSPQVSQADLVRGNPSGEWYVTYEPETIYWLDRGDELVEFRIDGTRVVYQRISQSNARRVFRRSHTVGAFDEVLTDSYLNGYLARRTSIAGFEQYTWSNSGAIRILTVSQHFCQNSACSNPVHKPELDREYHYNQNNFLIKRIGIMSESVDLPPTSGGLINVSSNQSSRPEVTYNYQSGRLTSIVYTLRNYSRTLMSLGWENIGGFYRVRSVTVGDITYNYSYQNLSGGKLVTAESDANKRSYWLDDYEHVIRYKEESKVNPWSNSSYPEPASLTWDLDWEDCGCGRLVGIDGPDGSQWRGEYEQRTGLLSTEYFSNPSGASGLVSFHYERASFLESGRILSVTGPAGTMNNDFTWVLRDWLGNESPDFKPVVVKQLVDQINQIDGSSYDYLTEVRLTPGGRPSLAISPSRKFGTTYEYETSRPWLVQRVITAPLDQNSNLQRTSAIAESLLLFRAPDTGDINGRAHGAPDSENPFDQMSLNGIGKVTSSLLIPGHGGTDIYREVYFGPEGDSVLVRHRNRDGAGNLPTNPSGSETGREWIVTQSYLKQNSSGDFERNSIVDIAATYKGASSDTGDMSRFLKTTSVFDPSTMRQTESSDWTSSTKQYNGYGGLASVSRDGTEMYRRYDQIRQSRVEHLKRVKFDQTNELEYAGATVSYNSAGYQTGSLGDDGSRIDYTYNDNGQLVETSWSYQNNEQAALRLHYDRLGQLVRQDVKDPVSQQWEPAQHIVYGIEGVEKYWAQTQDRIITKEYDNLGRLHIVTGPGESLRYEYKPNFTWPEEVWTSKSGQSLKTRLAYDNLGRKTGTFSSGNAGAQQEFGTTVRYDSLNRKDLFTTPQGTREHWVGPDGFTHFVRILDRLYEQRRSFDMNAQEVTYTGINEKGRTSTSVMNKYGLLTRLHRGGDQPSLMFYDAAFNLRRIDTGSGGQATFTYNRRGQIEIMQARDKINNPKYRTARVYYYDDLGGLYALREANTVNGNSLGLIEHVWERDRFGRIIAENMTIPGFGTRRMEVALDNSSSTPDFSGNVHAVTIDDLTYNLDVDTATGFINSVGFSGPGSSQLPTDVASFTGPYSMTTNFNGITVSRTLDAYGMPDLMSAVDSSSNIVDVYGVVRDGQRRIKALAHPDGIGVGQMYEYTGNAPLNSKHGVQSYADILGPYQGAQLSPLGSESSLATDLPSAMRETLVSMGLSSNSATTYNNDAVAGRPTSMVKDGVTYNFNYDGEGRIKNDGTRAYEYDAFGRLVLARALNGSYTEEYLYDARDRLLVTTTTKPNQSTEKKLHRYFRNTPFVVESSINGKKQVRMPNPYNPADIIGIWNFDGAGAVSEYGVLTGPGWTGMALNGSSPVERYGVNRDGAPFMGSSPGTGLNSAFDIPFNLFGMRYNQTTGLYLNPRNGRWYDPSYGLHLQRETVSGPLNSDGYTLNDNNPVQ